MSNMKKNVVWMVRDARGLTTYEKAFLFVVASRGTAKCYRKTLMEDMACSTGQLSNVVKSLREKNLINVYEGGWFEGKKMQTAYTVKEDALATFIPERSQVERGSSSHEPDGSPHERGSSPDERGSSRGGGFKETGKETVKETGKVTVKGTEDAESSTQHEDKSSPDEPSSPLSNNKKVPLAKKFMEEAREKKELEKAEGLRYLESLLVKNRVMDEQDKQKARSLFADRTYRSDKDQTQRASWAVFDAEPMPVSAAEPVVLEEDEW